MYPQDKLSAIRDYWDENIHDQGIASYPVGTHAFFKELDEYRFSKLKYLPKLIDFNRFKNKNLLEVGCGVGIDLVRFAKAGAIVTGIDLSKSAILLAIQNFSQQGYAADLRTMNGEATEFQDNTFDTVYAFSVLQYTSNANKMVSEIYRILKPGGEAILMVYNRNSWLYFLSKLTRIPIENEDAPVLKMFSRQEFQKLLAPFEQLYIITDRFPVQTQLHRGLRAWIYNDCFVRFFNLIPKYLIKQLGWHLIAFTTKSK